MARSSVAGPAGPPSAEQTYRRLRRWNGVVGLLHLVQAVLILLISADVALPVTASYLSGPPGSGERTAPETLFDLSFGAAVAAFLLLAAIDHLLVASPGVVRWYQRNLSAERNPARWWEYSVSASLMVVLIAMLTGIYDITALVALFGANTAMILFGLVMEQVNRPGNPVRWRAFVYGCIAGAVPWIAIGIQLVLTQSRVGGVPGFVFGIYFSLFVLFNTFAINMVLHYRRSGRWRNYLFGERAYILLSLVAKSALAWQVYAGALAG